MILRVGENVETLELLSTVESNHFRKDGLVIFKNIKHNSLTWSNNFAPRRLFTPRKWKHIPYKDMYMNGHKKANL